MANDGRQNGASSLRFDVCWRRLAPLCLQLLDAHEEQRHDGDRPEQVVCAMAQRLLGLPRPEGQWEHERDSAANEEGEGDSDSDESAIPMVWIRRGVRTSTPGCRCTHDEERPGVAWSAPAELGEIMNRRSHDGGDRCRIQRGPATPVRAHRDSSGRAT